jgi:hypothetical protein
MSQSPRPLTRKRQRFVDEYLVDSNGTRAAVAAGERVPSNIYKFDPASGDIIGRIEVFAHQLTVGADGALHPGTSHIRIGDDPDATSIVTFQPLT